MLWLDHPRNYTEWKEAVLTCNGEWEHCENRKTQHWRLGKPHATMYDPFSMIPLKPWHTPHDPDAMDTSADQGKARAGMTEDEHLCLTGAEDFQAAGGSQPPFLPWEGYLRRERECLNKGKFQCYNYQQYRHISRNCPQKKMKMSPITNCVAETHKQKTPEERANAWLRKIGEESDKVKELILQMVWRREDFQDTWTQQPGWGHFIVTMYSSCTSNQWRYLWWSELVTTRLK